jgi:hypothetical protein
MKKFARGFIWASSFLTVMSVGADLAQARNNSNRISLKSGESVELRNYFFVANCRSIMIGQPTLDVLEGPEEVAVTLKEGKVLPRSQNCASPVPGGTVVATAKGIAEPKEAKLTIRLKFNSKSGERQSSNTYVMVLYPAATHAGEPPHTSLPTNAYESAAPGTSH